MLFQGEIRIHLQRIPLQRDEEAIQVREIPIEVLQARPNVIRPIQAIRLQAVQPEREPQSNFPPREAALLRESFGLTNEDLMNIQRLAQERIEHELRSFADAQDDLSNDSNSSESDDDDSSEENAMNNQQQQQQLQQQQQQPDQPKTEEPKRK